MNDSLDALPGLRPLEAGAVFAGRFRVARTLGQGGMGCVYEAVQTALDRTVALKLLHPALSMDLSLVQRFQREAKLMAALRHPNIVEVIDAGVEDGALWIAMEFLRGESLARWLDRRGDRATPSELLPLLAPVGRALAHMHARDIVHRDVKPDNVMLALTDDGMVVPKLLDLGIAHPRAEGAKLTATGTLLGTPAYISPEQAWGLADISPAADQWSFAAMLYEAFTGRLPHAAETPMGIITRRVAGPAERPESLIADFDPALSAVLMRALEPSPEDRFASMPALLDALAPFGDMGPEGLGRSSLPYAAASQDPSSASAPYVTPAGLSAPALPAPDPPEPVTVPLPIPARPRVVAPEATAVATSTPGSPPSAALRAAPWLIAAAAALTGVLALRPRAETTPARDAGSPVVTAPADASPGEVTFEFDFAPSTARISLERNEIGAGHASLRVPRDGRAYALRVEAEGFVPYRDVLRATGDVQISRTLVPQDAGTARVAPRITPTTSAHGQHTPPAPPSIPPAAIPQRRPIDQTWTP